MLLHTYEVPVHTEAGTGCMLRTHANCGVALVGALAEAHSEWRIYRVIEDSSLDHL